MAQGGAARHLPVAFVVAVAWAAAASASSPAATTQAFVVNPPVEARQARGTATASSPGRAVVPPGRAVVPPPRPLSTKQPLPPRLLRCRREDHRGEERIRELETDLEKANELLAEVRLDVAVVRALVEGLVNKVEGAGEGEGVREESKENKAALDLKAMENKFALGPFCHTDTHTTNYSNSHTTHFTPSPPALPARYATPSVAATTMYTQTFSASVASVNISSLPPPASLTCKVCDPSVAAYYTVPSY
jgi:hypothetical protein